MLNIFMTLSFFTLLVYFDDMKKKRYLFLSAMFGAWAVLSKLSALFILPFYLLLFVYYLWPLNRRKMGRIITDYFSWILVFSLVCILFLPTIVTHPGEVYNLVFNPPRDIYYEEGYKVADYFTALYDYARGFFLVKIKYLAPWSVPALAIYMLLRIRKKHRHLLQGFPAKHVESITAYTLFFIILVVAVSRNHDIRFMSPAILMLNVFSAIGLYAVMELVMKKSGINPKLKYVFYAVTVLVVIFSQMMYIVYKGNLRKEAVKQEIIRMK